MTKQWKRGAVLLAIGLTSSCAKEAPPPEETSAQTHFAITADCGPCAQAAIPACTPSIDVAACIAACAPSDVACLEACVDAAVALGQALSEIAECVVCDKCAVDCDGAWSCPNGSGGGGSGGAGVGGGGVGGAGGGGTCDGSGDCSTCVACAVNDCAQQPDPMTCFCGACASDCAGSLCP